MDPDAPRRQQGAAAGGVGAARRHHLTRAARLAEGRPEISAGGEHQAKIEGRELLTQVSRLPKELGGAEEVRLYGRALRVGAEEVRLFGRALRVVEAQQPQRRSRSAFCYTPECREREIVPDCAQFSTSRQLAEGRETVDIQEGCPF